MDAQPYFPGLDLAGLHRTLDGVVLDQRVIGTQVDLQPSAAFLLDLVDELADVLGKKTVFRVAGRHGPGGLGMGCRSRERQAERGYPFCNRSHD